jgi:phosphoglycolate phosphatase-like HAD superfamily hydrolase
MNIVIFDLDNTLVETNACQPYLRTHAGREVIGEYVQSGTVRTALYDSSIVDYVNELSKAAHILVLVVSDSPKNYCLSVLRTHGFEVNENLVFGSQSKPCVNFDQILEYIGSVYNRDFSDSPVVVVGDSPKDIFFGFHIKAPSVFATWGSKFDFEYVVNNALPEAVAHDLDTVKSFVGDFLKGELSYSERDFSGHFVTLDSEEATPVEFSEGQVGFAREYVPDWDEFRNKYDRFTWFDVNWSIKKAKLLTPRQLRQNNALTFYSRSGDIVFGSRFKSNAGHYLKDFLSWLRGKSITGKIALVPMPSSLPRECNLSFSMLILCEWWAGWINQDRTLPLRVTVCDVLERFEPTPPSHSMGGVRTMYPHFKTIGLFPQQLDTIDDDVKAVVLIDDVWTSGSQMNSVATIMTEHNLIPASAELLAFTLVKTTHPDALEGLDLNELLKGLDESQKNNE